MNLCVTADRHWAIGKDGRPLVTIPADRQMFLKETAGKVVVMGRRTAGRTALWKPGKYCPDP